MLRFVNNGTLSRRPRRRVPLERVGEQQVVLLDEAPDRLLQLGHALEARVPDQPAVQDAEPDLDLVEPALITAS